MTLGQIAVLVWAVEKLSPKKEPQTEEKRQRKSTVIDTEAVKLWNWGLWLVLVTVAIAVVINLFIFDHPFFAGGFGGIALYVLSFPVKTVLKEQDEAVEK